jgi:hypothetical protein
MIWKWKKMRCPKNNLGGQEVEKKIRRGWKSKQRIVSHPNIKTDIKEATVENVEIIRILLMKYIQHNEIITILQILAIREIESIVNLRAEVRAMKMK